MQSMEGEEQHGMRRRMACAYALLLQRLCVAASTLLPACCISGMMRIYVMHLCFECMCAREVCKLIGADDVLDVLGEHKTGALLAHLSPHRFD